MHTIINKSYVAPFLPMQVGGFRRIIVPPELGYLDGSWDKQGPKPTSFSVSLHPIILCMHAEAGLLHGAPPGCCWCCEGGPPVISRCCNSAAKLPGFRIIQQALSRVRA